MNMRKLVIYSHNELYRIQNMIIRLGVQETLLFAERTYRQYRKCIFKTKNKVNDKFSHLSLLEYKKQAILSCLQFRHFIKHPEYYYHSL